MSRDLTEDVNSEDEIEWSDSCLPEPTDVRRVACVGVGTIGGGWVAYFLSRGLDVVASDTGPDAEKRMRRIVDRAWPMLEQLGLSEGASQDRLSFESDLSTAVADVDFVQESAFDREDLKIELFKNIDAAVRPGTVIASSSSEFLPTLIASECLFPERCIVGHPFSPSYLLPLVEVVGGELTAPSVLDWAMSFYKVIGKHALLIRKEIESYVSNRLQNVVYDEINRLVDAGVCDYAEADRAMVYGPGLRWAFAGPNMVLHLAGGPAGVRGAVEHWGNTVTPKLKTATIQASERAAGGLSMNALEAWRDQNLVRLLKSLSFSPGK